MTLPMFTRLNYSMYTQGYIPPVITREWYAWYRAQPHWVNFSRETRKKRKVCQKKNCQNLDLEVHHRNYTCLWAETDADVNVLCRKHHQAVEDGRLAVGPYGAPGSTFALLPWLRYWRGTILAYMNGMIRFTSDDVAEWDELIEWAIRHKPGGWKQRRAWYRLHALRYYMNKRVPVGDKLSIEKIESKER